MRTLALKQAATSASSSSPASEKGSFATKNIFLIVALLLLVNRAGKIVATR